MDDFSKQFAFFIQKTKQKVHPDLKQNRGIK